MKLPPSYNPWLSSLNTSILNKSGVHDWIKHLHRIWQIKCNSPCTWAWGCPSLAHPPIEFPTLHSSWPWGRALESHRPAEEDEGALLQQLWRLEGPDRWGTRRAWLELLHQPHEECRFQHFLSNRKIVCFSTCDCWIGLPPPIQDRWCRCWSLCRKSSWTPI